MLSRCVHTRTFFDLGKKKKKHKHRNDNRGSSDNKRKLGILPKRNVANTDFQCKRFLLSLLFLRYVTKE